MKSKSPFAIKSPLRVQVYGGDTYESPDTVITKTVGEQVGTAITGLADNASKYMDLKGKLAKGESDHTKAMELANLKYGKKTSGEARLGLTTPDKVGSSFGEVPKVPDLVSKSKTSSNINGRKILTHEANADNLGYKKNTQERADFIKASTADNLKKYKTDKPTRKGLAENYITFENGKRTLAINMNGSPVKHNAETALADAKQNNPFARMLKSNNVQQKLDAAKSQPRNFAGVIAQAISLRGGSAAGSIGQQIGNQAQQGAADAGGSTGVDPFLPPPNQVAETGSYGSGGDRDMLEMNGNQIDNQSIGRNTDITSQLFGSGQRASMLAMKGTPLHTEGHGGAKDHKHSPESRNSVIPKWKNGVNPYKTADKSISSIDEPRRLDKDEIGAPTEREQSDRDYLAKFDMEYKASGGNLYVPKKR